MTEVSPFNPHHLYRQVADALAARIQAGRYSDKLPSERQLAREFAVSYGTQRQAMRVLRQRGLIITRQGMGTFIAPDHNPQGTGRPGSHRARLSRPG